MKKDKQRKTIVFGVTDGLSLQLLGSIPSKLSLLGWDVEIIASLASREVPADLEGLRLHDIPMDRNPNPTKDLFSFCRWIYFLVRTRPDVVSIGTPKAAFLGIIASFICRVPNRVYHLRGLRLETATGFKRRILFLVELAIASAATHVLAVSNSLRDEYCNLGLSRPEKVVVLGEGSSKGVNFEHFDPSRWNKWQPPELAFKVDFERPDVILGYVGRFSPDKGVRDLPLCIQVLKDSGVSCSLLMIGPTKEEITSFVDSSYLDLGAIISLGLVDDPAPYYSLIDILLLPTRREGFPNVVLEAAAFHIPTVTMRATGAIDAVIDQETGIVVDYGDSLAFSEAVLRLSTNSVLRKRMGRNARERASKHFDQTLVANLHVDFYNMLFH